MNLNKIATQPVVALNPSDTLNKAIQQMWRLAIEHLPVVTNGKPVGMVSERDILLHCCDDGYAAHELTHRDPKSVLGSSRVDDIMSSPVVALSSNDSAEDAAHLMLREQADAILLVDNDSATGIVTQTDILKCFLDENPLHGGRQLARRGVLDVMHAHVFSVGPNDLKPTVIRLMRDKQIRHVPVVEDDNVLVGVVAESDVLLGSRLDRSIGRLSVDALKAVNRFQISDIMNAPVVLDVSSNLQDAARVMTSERIGCVPITDGTRLAGIVTNTDMIRAFVHVGD